MYYVLDKDGNPVKWRGDVTSWALTVAKQRKIVRTKIGDLTVSTVFLGMDHSFDESGPPLLFETMIFRDSGDGGSLDFQIRSSSMKGAVEDHHIGIGRAVDELLDGKNRMEDLVAAGVRVLRACRPLCINLDMLEQVLFKLLSVAHEGSNGTMVPLTEALSLDCGGYRAVVLVATEESETGQGEGKEHGPESGRPAPDDTTEEPGVPPEQDSGTHAGQGSPPDEVPTLQEDHPGPEQGGPEASSEDREVHAGEAGGSEDLNQVPPTTA